MQEPAVAVPALYDHCYKVYTAMAEEAVEEDFRDETFLVWTGFASRLLNEKLGIPIPLYGKVLYALKKMGCITQLRRGGGNAPSKWALHEKPTEETFLALWSSVEGGTLGRYKSAKTEQLEAQIADVRQSLGGVDVPRAFKDLMMQYQALEARVQELETKS